MPASFDAEKTPTALGYRMPAEWEPHAATWLSWPRPDGISFPDAYERVQPALCAMVDALADSEPVNINVCDAAHEKIVRGFLSQHGVRTAHVTFHHIPINEPWCRDHGPLFVTRREEPRVLILDWGYNAWGGKYPPFDNDDVVPTRVAEKLGLPVLEPGMILEGGSIDVNGTGTLLTTKSCLLNPNRNPALSQPEIEQRMRDYLGVTKILWLGDGIEGDDTDGHVDDLTRFVGQHSVVTVVEANQEDANHAPLAENLALLRTMSAEDGSPLEIHELPMPGVIVRDGQRLPASYANFYIANTVVLLPVFNDSNDSRAIAALAGLFPGRKVVPIDCTELIWGLGAFHCLTQQQPAVVRL
jgi:agmatine deiminase